MVDGDTIDDAAIENALSAGENVETPVEPQTKAPEESHKETVDTQQPTEPAATTVDEPQITEPVKIDYEKEFQVYKSNLGRKVVEAETKAKDAYGKVEHIEKKLDRLLHQFEPPQEASNEEPEFEYPSSPAELAKFVRSIAQQEANEKLETKEKQQLEREEFVNRVYSNYQSKYAETFAKLNVSNEIVNGEKITPQEIFDEMFNKFNNMNAEKDAKGNVRIETANPILDAQLNFYQAKESLRRKRMTGTDTATRIIKTAPLDSGANNQIVNRNVSKISAEDLAFQKAFGLTTEEVIEVVGSK